MTPTETVLFIVIAFFAGYYSGYSLVEARRKSQMQDMIAWLRDADDTVHDSVDLMLEVVQKNKQQSIYEAMNSLNIRN